MKHNLIQNHSYKNTHTHTKLYVEHDGYSNTHPGQDPPQHGQVLGTYMQK